MPEAEAAAATLASASAPASPAAPEALETFVETTTEALASLGADAATLATLEAAGDDLVETVKRQAERTDELEARLDEQADDAARDRAETKQRVSTLEEAAEADETPTSETADPTIQADETTPIEELSQSDDIETVTDSASVKRAVSLFENLPEWGQKAPKGIVLRPDDNPLSLLSAARDESLCWKQYYRAAQTLERLSKGAITFFDSDRHGKMLVLHEQSALHDRVTDGTLSVSSPEAPT